VEGVENAAAVYRIGLLAEISLAVFADVFTALGQVDDIGVAEIEPDNWELEVGMGAFSETEDVDVPVARGFKVCGLDQKMFKML
jgi:hypothetical protein